MDFTSDDLTDGRPLRTLNVVDLFTCECLAMEVHTNIQSHWVTHVLECIIHERGNPEAMVTENGPKFASRAFDQWCYDPKIRHHFIEPGKPMRNGTCESFKGRFPDECLNEYWFQSLAEARHATEA